ncbi:MAG: hypothetical protein AB8B60_08115 [Sulfitobacter sp.]
MKHTLPERRDPFKMLEDALSKGWQDIDTIPLKGEGAFLALTISGLVRLARNRKSDRRCRPADGYGPKRTTVSSVETGNYLGAIAWKWNDEAGLG